MTTGADENVKYPPPGKPLSQIAFEAHRDFLGGNRPWSDVRQPERELWEATAAAVVDALEGARAFIGSLPCMCEPGDDSPPCGRCAMLGEHRGEPRR